ncbi:uncharacterized protein LOC120259972 [Dioscorea cayenensis subsp. rotundata]|uniref:Uncharacterized protein LOC120259972 n=1 Tax=Dioscorea cayennensis subsp. rotundata TaxID=55577 RepID=A0AB40B8Q5_DIOCR|nr:uncharacterized protein LOC120259972 [Dioscorea cayenensis subsp. rotundata]
MIIDAIGPNFDPYYDENEEEMPNPTTQKLYDMLDTAEEPLWSGCESHTQLSAVARLLTIKSEFHISERCYDAVLQFMKEALPANNKLVDNFYNTKKFVAGLGLPCEKIHCCINGCMLYWGKDSDRRSCKVCDHPRYKSGKKGIGNHKDYSPNQKMYYFPLTPRLQRLYASKVTAKDMRWHKEHDEKDGVICHPSEAEAWKQFDLIHPLFASEARNVRLGLSADGFQPFGQSGKQYSCWPIIITPYNLPPWMCMKDPYMFLTVIVPGPKNPKKKLDVYLQPLIAELKHLWDVGVQTYDVSKKQNFQMRAALMWTISDFPAFAMLSGWSTAGKKACPYCMDKSKSFSLVNGGKWNAPICKSSGWHKRSIFWDLPYWTTNLIRHNLDVMHIEKNVFENVFDTVMDVEGKTKDNAKAREDVKIYCKRKELEKMKAGNILKACYSLSKEEKVVCEWVKSTSVSGWVGFKYGKGDSMEHLPIHLPYEAKIARGQSDIDWMYPFERFLRHLKKKVTNKAKVEGFNL